ncbi:ribonuclease E inhibitor RraB [Rhizobium leguminosarum]|uniref:ribonuclease E inhibitor RraB n=1 Tax=Rhizobium leguminosarum TaxID=384 RepID=UPI0014429663|nr:ribonuclease E inhibitor RraB [Rhizobium leguminosarum]NKJ77773.1 hypothetical protein [Rhizobium leguminosarum bv. viciae]
MSLLEHNARTLAKLEEEWSELGPLRPFQFRGRFPNRSDEFDDEDPGQPAEELAQAFADFASAEGCECRAWHDQFNVWYVDVSKALEPTAANITALQERLTGFVNGQSNAYLEGWNYPPKKEIRFWPDCSGSNKEAAKLRASVLFGSDLVADPIKHDKSVIRPRSKVFKVVPSEFLHKAQAMPPQDPQPTASAFSQWVYSLYGQADGSEEDIEHGKQIEKDIWERRRASASCNDNRFLRSIGSPWVLLHNGLHIHPDKRPEYYTVPHLRVNGQPLRLSPDLVYRNRQSGEVSIVEVKHSYLPLTKNLWPNVWAQLWCYAQIEVAANAPKVTAIGEVWSEMWSRGYGRGRTRVDGQKLVCLRASVRRDPRAAPYDRFFRALFEIYSR